MIRIRNRQTAIAAILHWRLTDHIYLHWIENEYDAHIVDIISIWSITIANFDLYLSFHLSDLYRQKTARLPAGFLRNIILGGKHLFFHAINVFFLIFYIYRRYETNKNIFQVFWKIRSNRSRNIIWNMNQSKSKERLFILFVIFYTLVYLLIYSISEENFPKTFTILDV